MIALISSSMAWRQRGSRKVSATEVGILGLILVVRTVRVSLVLGLVIWFLDLVRIGWTFSLGCGLGCGEGLGLEAMVSVTMASGCVVGMGFGGTAGGLMVVVTVAVSVAEWTCDGARVSEEVFIPVIAGEGPEHVGDVRGAVRGDRVGIGVAIGYGEVEGV